MSKVIKRKIREMVYLVMKLNEKGWDLRIRIGAGSIDLMDTNCNSIIKSDNFFLYLDGINTEKEIEETNKMLKEWLLNEVC